jgi:hypothetical protein
MTALARLNEQATEYGINNYFPWMFVKRRNDFKPLRAVVDLVEAYP